jgi:hypothetical protein
MAATQSKALSADELRVYKKFCDFVERSISDTTTTAIDKFYIEFVTSFTVIAETIGYDGKLSKIEYWNESDTGELMDSFRKAVKHPIIYGFADVAL